MNSHVSDPLIYLGSSQKTIQTAVVGSLCWMFSRDWHELDEHTKEECDAKNSSFFKEIDDEFAFFTHSMGSRITTDSLQLLITNLEQELEQNPSEELNKVVEYLQNKQLSIFMLANQLPLLQLGREIPEVTNQYADYCLSDGKNYDNRFFNELTVVALNDPNDILSYDIPPKFIDNYMDSRLCTNLINFTLNIADVVQLFRLGTFANPATAHSEYENNDRVLGIITEGISEGHTEDIINERCTWLEAI